MRTLAEIKQEVDLRAVRIGAKDNLLLPTYGSTSDGARPHIEVDPRGYHYVIVERGEELERHTTSDLDELLYRIFEGITFTLASKHELDHRVQARDSRRLLFQCQMDLLAQLSSAWGNRIARHHAQILRDHPFDDLSDERVRMTVQLRDEGNLPHVAWEKACETYPLPERGRNSTC